MGIVKETVKNSENERVEHLVAIIGALGYDVATLKVQQAALDNRLIQVNKRITQIHIMLETNVREDV